MPLPRIDIIELRFGTHVLLDQIQGEIHIARARQDQLAFRFVHERVARRDRNRFVRGRHIHASRPHFARLDFQTVISSTKKVKTCLSP